MAGLLRLLLVSVVLLNAVHRITPATTEAFTEEPTTPTTEEPTTEEPTTPEPTTTEEPTTTPEPTTTTPAPVAQSSSNVFLGIQGSNSQTGVAAASPALLSTARDAINAACSGNPACCPGGGASDPLVLEDGVSLIMQETTLAQGTFTLAVASTCPQPIPESILESILSAGPVLEDLNDDLEPFGLTLDAVSITEPNNNAAAIIGGAFAAAGTVSIIAVALICSIRPAAVAAARAAPAVVYAYPRPPPAARLPVRFNPQPSRPRNFFRRNSPRRLRRPPPLPAISPRRLIF